MQIFVYHGKYGTEYWLADTPERLEEAMRKLFRRLDEYGWYGDDVEGLAEARTGNFKAIRSILQCRRASEYEGWNLEEAVDPCIV